jgi:hypothetical protein
MNLKILKPAKPQNKPKIYCPRIAPFVDCGTDLARKGCFDW